MSRGIDRDDTGLKSDLTYLAQALAEMPRLRVLVGAGREEAWISAISRHFVIDDICLEESPSNAHLSACSHALPEQVRAEPHLLRSSVGEEVSTGELLLDGGQVAVPLTGSAKEADAGNVGAFCKGHFILENGDWDWGGSDTTAAPSTPARLPGIPHFELTPAKLSRPPESGAPQVEAAVNLSMSPALLPRPPEPGPGSRDSSSESDASSSQSRPRDAVDTEILCGNIDEQADRTLGSRAVPERALENVSHRQLGAISVRKKKQAECASRFIRDKMHQRHKARDDDHAVVLEPEKVVHETRFDHRGALSRAAILASPSPELAVRRKLAVLAGCNAGDIVDSVINDYLAELREEELHEGTEGSLDDEMLSVELAARADLDLAS